MNDLLRTLFGQLKGASGGTKAVAVLVGLAIVAAIGLTALVANRPYMQILRTGLTDHELAQVGSALGAAGIPFDASQPPGPFTLFVDEDDRYRALAEIYRAGALDKPLPGIGSDGGIGNVFDSAQQRTLKSWKKRWEEMEQMLLTLDFVLGAKVSTSLPNGSTLGRLQDESLTASVTLQVRGQALTAQQCATVAMLVSRGFGIDREKIVVSDQDGTLLFDGMAEIEDDLHAPLRDLAAHEERWEKMKTTEVNAMLAEVLGPRKAVVRLDSTWDLDQSVTREDLVSKGATISETTSSTETPIGENAAGGPAGFAANMPGADETGTGGDVPPAEPPAPPVAKSTDSETKSSPSTTSTEEIQNKYVLSRLSIALFVDESVPNPAAIRDLVANAVGYDADRDADFQPVVGPIHVPEVAENADEAADLSPGPMALVERYLPRGVEILTALVFIFLLLKSLKGAAASSRAAASRAAAGAAEQKIDPELLARAQVEELLRADPDRVGEILSAWAREETKAGAKP
ncbi:MAG: flagellar M-ring protein FliF C-terminal domain-containing protein [Planctomycetota bacterium]